MATRSSITDTLSAQGRKPTGALGWITAWTMPAVFRALYAKVAKRLDLQPDDDVLDVACGAGMFLKRHASHVRRVAGLDHSEIQIRLARRWNRDRVAVGTAEFIRGDASALPWEDDTFTAVTCNCVHCFDEPEQALREMQRVLRPGGRAVVVMQGDDKSDAGAVTRTDRWGIPIWSRGEVQQMMGDAGFSELSVSYDHKIWLVEGRKPSRAVPRPLSSGK